MNKKLMSLMILFFSTIVIANTHASAEYYTVVTNSNVRAAPTTNSHKIGYLTKGKHVQVVGSAAGDNWHQVRLASGQMGFVYAKLLLAHDDDDKSADNSGLVGGPTPAPKGAFSYIVWPNDGEIIPGGEFVVLFGLHGMGVAPASVEKAHTGHHHLLVDTDLPPLDKPIPSDDNYIHFGRGQTEYQIMLTKGSHTLQLLLGDKDHVPHTPPVMSEKITVHVH